jgi:peptide/nickel transport system permease protein
MNRTFKIGIGILAFLIVSTLVGPLLGLPAPDAIDTAHILEAPTTHHPFGTDLLGRDILSRTLHGGRVSLSIGFLVVLLATFLGVGLGAGSGLAGGTADFIVMRLIDVLLCFPVLFLVLSIVAMTDPTPWNIICILGLTSWMGLARLVRAETLSLKEREFVAIARSYGAGFGRILIRHIIPNALGPVIVSAILGVANAILAESALSFLGLGIQPPTPSWGNMLADAKTTLGLAWWPSVFPGAALFITLFGFHLTGDGLREHLRGAP